MLNIVTNTRTFTKLHHSRFSFYIGKTKTHKVYLVFILWLIITEYKSNKNVPRSSSPRGIFRLYDS